MSTKKVDNGGHCRTNEDIVDNVDIVKGSRDEEIFHVANCLVKGGMQKQNILKYLTILGNACKPPFPKSEIESKINSAMERSNRKHANLAAEVREWVCGHSGDFLLTDCYQEWTMWTREEKQYLSKILRRFSEEDPPLIEKSGTKRGQYKIIDRSCDEIDFMNADDETVEIKLPFDIQNLVEVQPGNIILVSGEQNAGKTCFMLNAAYLNLKLMNVYYFNSEMGSSELKKRLLKTGISMDKWAKMTAYERNSDFADVLRTGKGNLNIIDFLEIHDNFYEVSGLLASIHKRLNGAIAIVALQKNPGTDVGLGGFRSLEKPRLALSMSPGLIKIVKAKNWKTDENPNGLICDFKLHNGFKLVSESKWEDPNERMEEKEERTQQRNWQDND